MYQKSVPLGLALYWLTGVEMTKEVCHRFEVVWRVVTPELTDGPSQRELMFLDPPLRVWRKHLTDDIECFTFKHFFVYLYECVQAMHLFMSIAPCVCVCVSVYSCLQADGEGDTV